jgi:DNA-binding CsgD family transcriptional regulator
MLTALRAATARGRWPREAYVLLGLVVAQAATAAFFVYDIAVDLATGGSDDPVHDLMESLAVLALCCGVVFMAREVRRLLDRHRRMEGQLRAARGAFHAVMERHFADWALTPSERDVALLSIKGLSIADIAAARSTREGTVKAQLNAIYGKAGVAGRHQLLGLFIDELVDGPLPAAPEPAPAEV